MKSNNPEIPLADNKLLNYRKTIDSIDDKILDLLVMRFSTIESIGKYKKENNIAVVDKNRINQILSKTEKIAQSSGFDPKIFKNIYLTIIRSACIMEEKSDK